MLSGLKFDTFLGYSITRPTAAYLVDLCQHERVNQVWELGSGISTLIFNRLVKAGTIAQVTAVEHDRDYWQQTERALVQEGKSSRTQLLHRPLVNHWYDLNPRDIEAPIDLLLIDGPPGKVCPKSRQPALNFFYNYLAAGAYILLDDYYRQEEKEILQFWIQKYGLTLEAILPVGLVSAIAVCRR
uniref:Class I SAM-dependent methyltransferase n=1 Tax=Cyanothece sp. (strain PCC 7425 / ATCC 29141) TaxID=395961 RepID=B8HUV9_CYAP4